MQMNTTVHAGGVMPNHNQARVRAAALALLLLALVIPTVAARGDDNRAPDLGDYQNLRVPEGHKVAFSAYAEGVQIYRWTGTGWVFVAPDAVLYDQDDEVVGTHYAGPTWESNSGSKVLAMALERATPDPAAIPWLLLGALSSEGPGPFDGVTFIQRVNTTGGLLPSYDG